MTPTLLSPERIKQPIRTNQQWLDALRGTQGSDSQRAAYLDLANYLYRVAYNYLLKRQSDIPLLAEQGNTALAELAQDCVQDTLVKFWRNEGEILAQYAGKGRFLGWAALIIRNEVAGTLRRPPYTKEVLPPAEMATYTNGEASGATQLAQAEVGEALAACLNTLTTNRRAALISCMVDGEPSKVVARRMQLSGGAVDQLVLHAKRQMRACLEKKGMGREILALYAND